ncbi:hypothetical protein HPP92_020180 [Vanilla planifolia]|uniref:Uncharacterized protein n=1 Tax=Vanilla planifolia TaxID=51239 RepID=A0A835UNM0_VANPL|nr:hypothetical protein HPP92_020180 [Vanilla planifolia]
MGSELSGPDDRFKYVEDLHLSLLPESYSENPALVSNTSNSVSCASSIGSSNAVHGIEKPRKVPKINAPAKNILPATASSASILSFGKTESPTEITGLKRSNDAMPAVQELKKESSTVPRSCSQNRDHVLAERKRREKLSEKFIALSAVVPGLKKMDKASILADAIKYLKAMQEKVISLEEQAAKITVEIPLHLKKSQISAMDDEKETSLSDENLESGAGGFLPDIEVKLSDKSLLIKIHCEDRKGMLVRALSEIDKLELTVLNTSVMPFAPSALDITVLAQIEEGFSLTVKELVKKLSSALRRFI